MFDFISTGYNVNMSLVQNCQSCNSTGGCTFQTQCNSVQKLVLCTVGSMNVKAGELYLRYRCAVRLIGFNMTPYRYLV